ncbi:MAG: hypothetical protein MUC50_23120 [Myxococcota bacterium]|jgi:hypothetical protein|nr:hypothetical protein [Myxococcota bacterium]
MHAKLETSIYKTSARALVAAFLSLLSSQCSDHPNVPSSSEPSMNVETGGTSTEADTTTDTNSEQPKSEQSEGVQPEGTNPAEAGLRIMSAAARSCDVVIAADSGSRISGVTFDDAVLGKSSAPAPNTSISLVSKRDEAFPKPVAKLQLLTKMAPKPLTVVSAMCFDNQGNPIADPGASLNEALKNGKPAKPSPKPEALVSESNGASKSAEQGNATVTTEAKWPWSGRGKKKRK